MTLARLEEAKLVERRQDEHHGRRQLAYLTSNRKALAEAANAAVMEVEQALEGAASPLTLTDALALMNRMFNAISGSPASRTG